MPCNSDYLGPNAKEKNKNEVAKHLVYVLSEQKQHIPDEYKQAAGNIYGQGIDLDEAVRDLCSIIQLMDKKELDEIVYNGRSRESRKLADWWDEHKKADEGRVKLELKAIKDEKIKQKALEKLTPYERKLLGL